MKTPIGCLTSCVQADQPSVHSSVLKFIPAPWITKVNNANDPPTQEKAGSVNFRQELNCDILHVGFPNQLGFLWLAIEIFFRELMSWEFSRGRVISPKATRALFQGGGIDSSQQKQQWLGRLEVFEFEWFVYDGRFSTRPVGLWFFCFNFAHNNGVTQWHEKNWDQYGALICHSGPLESLVRNIDRRNPANHQWSRKNGDKLQYLSTGATIFLHKRKSWPYDSSILKAWRVITVSSIAGSESNPLEWVKLWRVKNLQNFILVANVLWLAY